MNWKQRLFICIVAPLLALGSTLCLINISLDVYLRVNAIITGSVWGWFGINPLLRYIYNRLGKE